MEIYEIIDSAKWKDLRKKRIHEFVKHISYVLIIFSGLWILISIKNELYALILFQTIIFISGFIILFIFKAKKYGLAISLILSISTLYLIITCQIASGSGINYGTSHFWFIALALASFFLLNDLRSILRDSIPLVFLSLFFLYHFDLIPVNIIVSSPVEVRKLVLMIDVITLLILIFIITRMFVRNLNNSEVMLANYSDRMDGLVDNMLPASIAERLRAGGKTFAESHDECSVLFADIVNFTSFMETKTPDELVTLINDLFSKFDDIADELNVTKIKTIGDSYMAIAGIPDYDKLHAEILNHFAFRILAASTKYEGIMFKISISSGPVVAGVIGKKRLIYDVWGDTVNIASRMESSGEAGRINISGATYQLVKELFPCTYRGKISAKNKGEIDMYFVDPVSN